MPLVPCEMIYRRIKDFCVCDLNIDFGETLACMLSVESFVIVGYFAAERKRISGSLGRTIMERPGGGKGFKQQGFK